MRRWLLGGFALFAFGAAMPVEIRECLPVREVCARRPACPISASARAAHCPMAQGTASTAATAAARACPVRGLAPAPTPDCRMTPTLPARADAGLPTAVRPAAAVALLAPSPAPPKIVAVPEPPRPRSRFVASPARPPEGCRPPPTSAAFPV